MTLHQLKIFTVVARHLNVRVAAGELHITQPSVSKQVRVLEKEFGAEFHIKVGRNIELTNEGRLFLKDAQALLSQAEKLREKFDCRSAAAKAATLTVGGSYNPSATLLPSAIARFKEKHPLVQLSVKTDTKRAIEQMVLNGEVEIAAVNNPPKLPDLVMEFFRREKLVAFVPCHHRLAKNRSLAISDLARIPLVIRGEKDGGMTATEEILKGIENQGVALKIAVRCDSPEAVTAAVRQNMGLGLLFEGLVMHDARRGDFKILKIGGLSLVGQSFIVYRKDRPLSPNALEFRELLYRSRRKNLQVKAASN